jgi:hypothetical protein
MRQMAALVVSITWVLAGALGWAQTQTWIVIEAGGKERGAFVPRTSPYTEGGPTVGVYLFDRQNVRTGDGDALTGFECLGWIEGTAIRVQVFALVPKTGQPNTYMPNGDAKNLQRRDFASYLVRPGQSRSITEMKALGIEPLVLRAAVRDVRPR